jgi:hypothetical protein
VYDFHPQNFVPTLLLATRFFYGRHRYALGDRCGAMAFLCKEHAGLSIGLRAC